MELKDYKGRKFNVGDKIKVQENIPSTNGMLYKNSIVKLDEVNESTEQIRVIDSLGKIWWIEPHQVSASFL